jgi:hypothetical protein
MEASNYAINNLLLNRALDSNSWLQSLQMEILDIFE